MRSRSLAMGFAFLSVLFLGRSNAWGEDFRLKMGAQFQGWSADFSSPYNGWELWAPFSLAYNLDKELRFFLMGKLGTGSYTDSVGGTQTLELSNFTDTVVGAAGRFIHFGLPALLDLRLNLPTGDPTWEEMQIPSSIPTEFIGSRYQGRGLGVSGFYGLSFTAGETAVGAGLGYLYTEAFVTDGIVDAATEGLRLGDAIFLVLNRSETFKGGKSSIFRLTSTYFLPTLEAGEEIFHMGPSFGFSYGFEDPAGFSYEAGLQLFTPARRPGGSGLVTEPRNSFGQRIHFHPSYALSDDWTLAGRFKFILPNDYATSDLLYNGGGFLLGLEPSYRMRLDDVSSLRFTASYDRVLHLAGGDDGMGGRPDASYDRWVFGTDYQVGF